MGAPNLCHSASQLLTNCCGQHVGWASSCGGPKTHRSEPLSLLGSGPRRPGPAVPIAADEAGRGGGGMLRIPRTSPSSAGSVRRPSPSSDRRVRNRPPSPLPRPEGLPTPEIEMGFEKESPTTDQLRLLIWNEVLRYHPQLAPSEKQVGGPPKAPTNEVIQV